MAVKTKSIFQPADTSDGYRVLITRFYPRGVHRSHFDAWASSLSPNPDLLFGYKEGRISWGSFKDSFIAQLRNEVESLDAILALYDWNKNHDVTLLCYERSGQPCHRHLVRDIVENPALIGIRFESKQADDHERISMQGHIPDQEGPINVALAHS
jgi:uncharacterized protein YeaO (DUF488 family)